MNVMEFFIGLLLIVQVLQFLDQLSIHKHIRRRDDRFDFINEKRFQAELDAAANKEQTRQADYNKGYADCINSVCKDLKISVLNKLVSPAEEQKTCLQRPKD